MLQVALVTALLVSPSSPTAGPSVAAPSLGPGLLARMPEDTELHMLMGDLNALLTAESPGPLGRLLGDTGILDALEEVTQSEVAGGTFRLAIESLAPCVRGAAVGSLENDEDSLFVVSVTDDFEAALEEVVQYLDVTLTNVTFEGQELRSYGKDDHAFVMAREGDLVTCWLGIRDEDEAMAPAYSYVVEALKTPTEGRSELVAWAEEVDIALEEVVLAMRVPLASMEEEEPFLEGVLGDLNGAVEILVGHGPEDTAILNMGLHFTATPLSTSLADAFGPARLDLLNLAPEDAFAASAYHIDIPALLVAMMEHFPEEFPSENYEAGLEAASSFLGLDVETDLLENFTGDFFSVQFVVPDMDVALDAEPKMGELVDYVGALGFTIAEPDPFYTLFELAETYTPEEMLTTGEAHGFDVWTFEIEPGAAATVALGESSVLLGSEASVQTLMERIGGDEDGSFMSTSRRSVTESECEGFALTLFELEPVYELVSGVFELIPEEDSSASAKALTLEIFRAMGETVTDTGWGSMVFESDRVEIKLIAR